MKIGLIVPKILFEPDIHTETAKKVYDRFFSKYSIVFGAFGAAPPLLAALTPDDHDVKIIDENHEELDYEEEFDVTLDEHLDKSLQLYLEFVEKVN